jgi:glycosyltransferase involved in cell wall biosynthesis
MKKIPQITIIITNYNYEKYLQRCIRSCINQINVDHEVILVDDCSTDRSLEMITPFSEQVRVFKTPENSGVAAASNLGIKNARGQFIIRVDADDYVSSEMCYFMKKYLESNHDAFCVSCDYEIVDDYENMIERKYASKDNISCGIMYRKDVLVQLGAYNEEFRHREEEELRKRLGDYYKIHHLNIPFYRYRMHSTNKTKTNEYRETKV